MTRILVLDAHPRAASLGAALASRYADGARAAGHDVRSVALRDLPLDLTPPDPAEATPPPLWVSESRAAITTCDLWAIVAPLWWGGLPATLEVLFARVLSPGFAYRWRDRGPWWDRLLVGRRARVILTMDTPPWFLRWVWGAPIARRLKHQVLGFCGFAPVRFTLLGPVRSSTAEHRDAWLATVAELGRRGV